MTTLRRAEPADADGVRALVRAAYAKWVPLIGREPLPMTADYARAIGEHEVTLLHVGGRLTALIELIRHADHLFIENIAVAPDCQGRGHGRRLLRHAEEIANAYALPELRLLTNGAFRSNVALYQSVGYHIDREEPFISGVAVHMSKHITRAHHGDT